MSRVEAPHIAPARTHTARSPALLAIAGVGALAMISAVVPWLIGSKSYDDLNASCFEGSDPMLQAGCPADRADRIHQIQSSDALSTGLLIGGGVVTAVGIVLFVAVTHREPDAIRQGMLTPFVNPTARGAGLSLRF